MNATPPEDLFWNIYSAGGVLLLLPYLGGIAAFCRARIADPTAAVRSGCRGQPRGAAHNRTVYRTHPLSHRGRAGRWD